MVDTLAKDQVCPGVRILLVFSVAAIVSVGEEAGPVDLPVVDDPIVGTGVLVNDHTLGTALVPAQSELGHIQLD